MVRKMRGLFLNTQKEICSIYESGKMCFDALCESDQYSLDYCELSAKSRDISLDYDFYIFNYHFVQMAWLDTKAVKRLPGFKATIVLEMSQDSPFDCVSPDDFDAYLVLDPTCRHYLNNVYAFPRPLEASPLQGAADTTNQLPVVGTFGLSYADKGFDEVVKAVNREFDAAIVRINVPNSKHAGKQAADDFQRLLSGIALKNDVKIELTSHFFDKDALIAWCAQNTLNVFLYNRRVGNGLSATTDQAIASGRPLAVSTNPTFRHIHSYIKPYPYLSLKGAIETTGPIVKQIQQDWGKRRFAVRFEAVLAENNVQPRGADTGAKTKLPATTGILKTAGRIVTRQRLGLFVPPVLSKIVKKIRRAARPEGDHGNPASPAPPFVHQALLSNSLFQEDLLVDLLLGRKSRGTYVDIGAGDPFFDSNTHRLHSKGWEGINIEPGEAQYRKICAHRGQDVNLNIAISDEAGRCSFYEARRDPTFSTFDLSAARRVAQAKKLVFTRSTVESLPLSKVLETHLRDGHIDFMSVNSKGDNLKVLASNDWDKYRPTLIMVDCRANFRAITVFLEAKGYLYIFCNQRNALFADKMSHDQSIRENITWAVPSLSCAAK